MRSLHLAIGFLLPATPLAAQSAPLHPAPRPAAEVWVRSPAEPFAPRPYHGPTTGAGTGTILGAVIGAGAGVFLAHVGCAFAERGSCGGPQLVGLLVGGLSGAMIGSAFEGDQTPEDDPPPASP